jgi:hypothetical protein
MFKVEKGQVIIDADIIGSIPAFTVLYNRDTSPEKKLAMAKFRIIFHLNDPRSPYDTSSTNGRITKIVMDLFQCADPVDEEQAKLVIEWFDKYYVPKKVNKAKEKEKDKEAKAKNEIAADEEIIVTDAQFERASRQYLEFLDLIPEFALKAAAQDAVHRLADEIKDPKTHNGWQKLQVMNQAIKDLGEMKDLLKVEEERQRTTKGGHNVRKREDPDYILSKTPLRK